MEPKLQLSSQGGLGGGLDWARGTLEKGRAARATCRSQCHRTWSHLQSPVRGVRPHRAAKQPPYTCQGWQLSPAAVPKPLGIPEFLRTRNSRCLGASRCSSHLPVHSSDQTPPSLTWAVCRLFCCHLHEESDLLALGERVPCPDPREAHAEEQPRLPGGGLLFNPLPLRTLLLCGTRTQGHRP